MKHGTRYIIIIRFFLFHHNLIRLPFCYWLIIKTIKNLFYITLVICNADCVKELKFLRYSCNKDNITDSGMSMRAKMDNITERRWSGRKRQKVLSIRRTVHSCNPGYPQVDFLLSRRLIYLSEARLRLIHKSY